MCNVISDWVHTAVMSYKIWVNFIETFEQTSILVRSVIRFIKKKKSHYWHKLTGTLKSNCTCSRCWGMSKICNCPKDYLHVCAEVFLQLLHTQTKPTPNDSNCYTPGVYGDFLVPGICTFFNDLYRPVTGAYFNAIRCTIGPSTLLSVHHQANACPTWQ